MKSNPNLITEGLSEASAGISAGLRKFLGETNKNATQQLGEARKDAQEQIFGLESELKEGEEFALSEEKSEESQEKTNSAEHNAYFREVIQSSERHEREEHQQLKEQIEEVRIEIKKLKDASEEMEQVFEEVDTQEAPVEVGKYHLNFYEWVFFTIKNARKKMEEVNTLGAIFQSRKQEKSFKALSKSQGTKYSMSGEHSIVRQNG